MTVKPYAALRFCVRNRDAPIWFEHEIDLMDKKGNGLKAMSNEITDRRNKFAFLVFKKLVEETGSWLEGHGGSRHRADIKDIHDRARKIKDGIGREHKLDDKRAGKYEKQVPAIRVYVWDDLVHITSGDWFDAMVGKADHDTIDVDRLHDKIKKDFRVFHKMIYCKLEREIRNTLLDIEKALFRDKWLIAVKTDFDQRMTVPILDLKKWVGGVITKTDSSGRPNPDHISGMDALAYRDLTMAGPYAQTYATKAFHEGNMVKVLGVENQPWRLGINPDTGKNYDVDIWLECDGKKIPVQVGFREGESARKISDATKCLGEKSQSDKADSKLNKVCINFEKKIDFAALCKKLGQVPPGGIVLWVSLREWVPGIGPTPMKEWYGEVMDKKCVIVWVVDDGKAVIHHNDTGFDLTLARKLCEALNVAKPNEQTDSRYSFTDPVDVRSMVYLPNEQTDFENGLTECYAPDESKDL